MFIYSVFFFKQKTAYEMRISDWSSDVCSSDLNDSSGIAPPAHQPCFPLVLVESAHVFIAAVSTLAQPEDSGARRHWPRRSPPFREDWIGKPSADAAASCTNRRPARIRNAPRMLRTANGCLQARD